jgi:hypothetical protein
MLKWIGHFISVPQALLCLKPCFYINKHLSLFPLRPLRLCGEYLLFFLVLAWLPAQAAGEVSVRAAVERNQVYQGETFLFQIQVRGTNKVEAPQLKATDDFSAQYLGGQDSSSRMVTNINGQVSEQVNEAYNLNWQITAKRTGTLTLPALSIKAAGKAFQTQTVSVQVLKPEETEDFKLRQNLSQTRVYVGEPVVLTVVWYLGKDVRNVQFSAPVLGSADFHIVDPSGKPDPTKRYARLGIQGQEVLAEQGRGKLDGREYTTVTFRRVLIPKRPGAFPLPAATVACEAPSGKRQSRSMFDDFFSMGMGGSYQRVVTPSNSATLEVLDVPAQGRPANFSGNVGRFTMEAQAQPTSVRVGDPITLTIKLAGPSYLEGVKPPRLDLQETIAKDFKVPEESSNGKAEGGKMVFVQTLRAKTPDVKEIPPIELSYFDTRDGSYKVARTPAIPIRVEATRMVTAWDAEGSGTGPEAKELKSFAGGISANYEDSDALSTQAFGPTGLLMGASGGVIVLLPPLVFLMLLAYTRARRRREADPLSFRARGAGKKLARDLKAAGELPEALVHATVLDAFRWYLGAKLKLPAAALTYSDAEAPLLERGLAPDELSELKALLDSCEAERFAGGESQAQGREILSKAEAVASLLERRLG